MLAKVFYTENSFLNAVFLLLLVSALHISAVILNSGVPFALLYGPLLFYAHLSLMQQRPNKSILLFLFFPFFFIFIWYIFLKVNFTPIEEMLRSYYLVYFISMVLSLFIFPVCVLVQRMKWVSPVSYLKSVMIQQLSVVCLAISLFIALMLMEIYFGLQLDVPILYIIIILLALSIGILLRYTYQEMTWEHQIDKRRESVDGDHLVKKTYSLPLELLEDYAERVQSSLQEDKLYLRPGLSVELLAQETKIPRHHFSELFNVYLGKSFYRIIAEYRIENALDLLKDRGDSLTIEALAYESGFNSKTSFNKYFKEITGYLPSEFRNRQSV